MLLKVNPNKLVNLEKGMEALFNPFNQYLFIQKVLVNTCLVQEHSLGGGMRHLESSFLAKNNQNIQKLQKVMQLSYRRKNKFVHMYISRIHFGKFAYTLKIL